MNNQDRSPTKNMISRRSFLRQAGAAASAFAIVPRYVLGGPDHIPPSEKLNVAIIGAGGQGITNMKQLFTLEDVRIAAVCDVCEEADYSRFYYGGVAGRGPALKLVQERYKDDPAFKGCAEYVDLREMLDKESHIDAVLIATPDHMHAPAALEAIARGKHVYCEKPLAHSIYEVRQITEAARQAGVATQMGNHAHSEEGIRLTVEWLRDGAIGDVQEVHAWSLQMNHAGNLMTRPAEQPPVPQGLDWDRWLGPAPKRPYHPLYTPFRWRAWWDFGSGTLGDLGCHHLDAAVWALELDYPSTVEARVCQLNDEVSPFAAVVYYQFPARGKRPPVKVIWYSGLKPPRPEEMPDERDFIGRSDGVYYVGSKGKMMTEGWSRSPRLIPLEKTRDYLKPPQTLPRSNGHHRDWVDACKGGKPAGAHFDYGGPLTEIVLAGVVAMRTGEKLTWDGPAMKAVNCPDADRLIRPEYHNGWTLPGAIESKSS